MLQKVWLYMVQHLRFRVLKFPFYPIIVFNSSVNLHGWILPSRQKTPNTTRSVQNFGGRHVSTFKWNTLMHLCNLFLCALAKNLGFNIEHCEILGNHR